MTPEKQRELALEKANEVRLGRAELKRQIKAGKKTVAEALEHPYAASLRVADLLALQKYWGVTKVNRLLSRAAYRGVVVAGTRRVRDLTDKQREALCSELEQ